MVISTGEDVTEKHVWIDLENASLEDIVTEYDVLKDIILDVLSPTTSEEKNKVIETILYYMGLSAWEFSKQNNIHHEQIEQHLKDKIHEETQDKLWFEKVLDSLPIGLLIVERTTGNLLFVNKAAKALAGGFYPMEILPDVQSEYYAVDAEGKRISRNDLPRFRVARGERLYGTELTAYYPGGHVTVVMHSGLIPAMEGYPERIVVAFQEIEERKKKEEHQKEVVKSLKEERVIREAFVSSLTHDLRTPLSVARMHTEMIARKVDSPGVLDKCHKIIKHIDEVDRMIQDLLDANRLKAGQSLPVHLADMCMNDVINDSIDDFVDLHGDRFIFHSPPGKICGHWCPKGMRRIMDNLLGNAVKYGHSNSPVEVSLSQDDLETSIEVHNAGPCISNTARVYLFQPFKRPPHSAKKGGWGIGLSLVKGIVDAHNGKIFVDSNDKEGTTFRIVVPNRAVEKLH
jgi:signal transduction histidine kinase